MFISYIEHDSYVDAYMHIKQKLKTAVINENHSMSCNYADRLFLN